MRRTPRIRSRLVITNYKLLTFLEPTICKTPRIRSREERLSFSETTGCLVINLSVFLLLPFFSKVTIFVSHLSSRSLKSATMFRVRIIFQRKTILAKLLVLGDAPCIYGHWPFSFGGGGGRKHFFDYSLDFQRVKSLHWRHLPGWFVGKEVPRPKLTAWGCQKLLWQCPPRQGVSFAKVHP